MISGVDIEDMKPLSPIKATNHVGYGVQYLSKESGWQWCTFVFALEDMAKRACISLQEAYPGGEFRTYEVVK